MLCSVLICLLSMAGVNPDAPSWVLLPALTHSCLAMRHEGLSVCLWVEVASLLMSPVKATRAPFQVLMSPA